IAEAAMLAGTVAGPEVYNPRKHPDKALTRRAFVLSQMHEKGFLSDSQYENAKDEPVKLAPPVTAEEQLAPEAVQTAGGAFKVLGGGRRAARRVHDHDVDRSAPSSRCAQITSRRARFLRQETRREWSVQAASCADRRQEGAHDQAGSAQGAAVRRHA